MSYIPVAFFSKVLKPGEPAEIELDEASALITSVTYGEEVSGSKRSALSLTYLDRMAEPEEEIDEKEDEDEDDDSDASFNTHAVMRKTVVASLIPGKIENASINVILNSSEAYELSVTGDNEVHVTGQYVFFPNDAQDDEEDSEDDYDSEIGSDEDLDPAEFGEYDPETGLLGGEITGMDQEGDSEDEEEEDDARFEELKDESPKKAASEKKQIAGGDVSMDADASGVSAADTSKLSKNQKKKLKKAEKQQEEGAEKAADIALKATAEEPAAPASDAQKAETASAASETKKPSRKQTLPSGLVIEDAKVGKGPAAKKGQMLSMRYIGKLANGKVFDSNTKGNPFKFKFGTGEVIKGWDEGMKGMSAGGERKLVIPASLAYGKKGVDGIPGGASLHFDVKLLSIK